MQIVQAGHPVLRAKARAIKVGEFVEPEINGLIPRMIDSLREAPGVGLAAPQVGESLQLAIVEDRPEYVEKFPPHLVDALNRKPVELQVLANPSAEPIGDSTTAYFEGCLSVPGYRAVVTRFDSMAVKALDAEGKPIEFVAEGWHARIIQHEFDHLNGTLYIDRMNPRSFMTHQAYAEHWAGTSVEDIRAAFVTG